MLLGMGLFTTLGVHTGIGVLAVFQIIQGFGMGLLYCTYVRLFTSVPYPIIDLRSSPSWPHCRYLRTRPPLRS